MEYSINFQALAMWIGVAAVVAGGYFVVSSDSSQQNSFNIGMDEDTVPGELTRLSVKSDGEPVYGANISINGEFIGSTNSQGIKGFETPETNFTVEASKQGIFEETTFTVENGSFSSTDDSEDSDSSEDSADSSDGSNNQDDSEDDTDDSENRSDDSDTRDQSDDGQDDQDQQEDDDTTEEITNDFTGLELDEDPMVGELRTLTVYEDGEEVSGAEVTINGEVIGTTNAGGTISFGIPDSAEISISTDTGLSETFSVEDYTEEEQDQTDDQNETEENLITGLELDSDPIAGGYIRVSLYDDNDPVEGTEITVNGDSIGSTDSSGKVGFEVPNTQEITVNAQGFSSQVYQVSGNLKSSDVKVLAPVDGEIFTGSSLPLEIDVEFERPEQTSYQVILDGQMVAEGDKEDSTVTETVEVDEGSHQVYVRALQDNLEAESETVSFDVLESVDVSFSETSDGDTYPVMNRHIAETGFNIQGGADQYQVEVNGTKVEEGAAGYTNYYEHRFDQAGDYEIVVKALYDGSVEDQIQATVQSQPPPQPQVNWLNDTVETSTPDLYFEIDSDAEYDVEATVTSSEGESAMYYSRERVDPSTFMHNKETAQLPQGTHAYNVTVWDQSDVIVGGREGTFDSTVEKPLADIQSLEYQYNSAHLVGFTASVYEDYNYEIKIDGETRASGSRDAEDISLSKDVGTLSSGQEYTATLILESQETEKTMSKQQSFTAG